MFVRRAPALLFFLPLAIVGCQEDAQDASPSPVPEGPPVSAQAQAMTGPSQPLDLSGIAQDEGDPVHAPIVVIEFSDFGCVFCARFHDGNYKELRDEFVGTGDVIWRYIPVTIGGFPNGDGAASAALCVADQVAFAGIRDRLYAERDVWLRQSGADARETFRGYAEDEGVDLEAWSACMEDAGTQARLEMANRAAAQAGVRGTPSFVVQGFMVQGAPPLENFQLALRQLVQESRAEPPSMEP